MGKSCRPPHLPHPRSRSLETALDRSEDESMCIPPSSTVSSVVVSAKASRTTAEKVVIKKSTTLGPDRGHSSVAGLSKSMSLASSSLKAQTDSSAASSMAEISTKPLESPIQDSASNSAAASSDASDSGIFFDVKSDTMGPKKNDAANKLTSHNKKSLNKYKVPNLERDIRNGPRGPLTSYVLGVGPKLVKPQDVAPNFDHRNNIFRPNSRKNKRNKDAELYIRETPSNSSLDSSSKESKHTTLNSSEPITTHRHKDKKNREVDPFNNYYNKIVNSVKTHPSNAIEKNIGTENEQKTTESSLKHKEVPLLSFNKYNPYNPTSSTTGRKALSPVLSASESPSPIISATIPNCKKSASPPLTDPMTEKKSPSFTSLDDPVPSVSISGNQSPSAPMSGFRPSSSALLGNRTRSVSTSENRSPSISLSGNPSPSSSISGLRSPSLISSSSNASLSHRNKESVFHFPQQVKMPMADARRATPDRDSISQTDKSGSNSPSDILSKIQKFNESFSSQNNSPQPSSPSSSNSSSNENTRVKPEKSLSLPTAYVLRRKPASEKKTTRSDLKKEANHVIDLLATCEKYLKEDEDKEISEEEDSTLASTRRSSMTSIGSVGSTRRYRRLSSIPLEEDIDHMFANSDSGSGEEKVSDPSNATALFSAIASLSNVGSELEPSKKTLRANRFSGHYEGFPSAIDSADIDQLNETTVNAAKLVDVEQNPAFELLNEGLMPDQEKLRKSNSGSESPAPESPTSSKLSSSKIPTASHFSDSCSTNSSIIDKYMNKVRTFIKK